MLIVVLFSHPDAYHTLYCLVGLGASQNFCQYTAPAGDENPLKSSFGWSASTEVPGGMVDGLFDEDDRVPPLHPVFSISFEAAEKMRTYFERRPLDLK